MFYTMTPIYLPKFSKVKKREKKCFLTKLLSSSSFWMLTHRLLHKICILQFPELFTVYCQRVLINNLLNRPAVSRDFEPSFLPFTTDSLNETDTYIQWCLVPLLHHCQHFQYLLLLNPQIMLITKGSLIEISSLFPQRLSWNVEHRIQHLSQTGSPHPGYTDKSPSVSESF